MQQPGRARRFSDAARRRVAEWWQRMPPDAGAELRQALIRLRKARSPRQAVAALEDEVVNLFDVVAPKLVENPLPLYTPARARTVVTAVAGSAAAVEEIEAIALLLPGVDAFAAPTLPIVIASSFTALTIEAYIASSLRVHMLRAAGRTVDASEVTRDTMRAMTGRDDVKLTKAAAQMMTRRMLRRWSRGVVPFVGIGYATWDAQRTISEIARMSR
jgi:hypothetical protein